MHSLLKRQIRKYIPENLKDSKELVLFIEAIDKSYSDYEEKSEMIQRAMKLSSDELYKANKDLRAETESQKKTLNILKKAINILNDSKNVIEDNNKISLALDPIEIVNRIEKQAKDIVRMTAENKAMVKNLERQNEALKDYAHMVSHDLKSPIRNINALMCWILEEEKEKFSNESKENCNLVSQNLEKMDSLIEGILRHSAIDSLEEPKIHLDLNKLIDEIKKTIYYPNTITIDIIGSLPTMYVEKYKIEQLFKNLITNAVTATEHREKGVITIDCINENEFWKFSVTDNGKGIAKKHQESIFTMFKKLENKANATGIGLALVKKVVNIYEGDIWLSSAEDQGTIFYFTLKK
ncbi:GHKL domain-containing protein [Cellulophaga baltica]|uniref:sensor histidine kinase n=1 Tax=Cellulophaga TaxID=104264 RepID=UPI001C06E20B|nr:MULTISPECIES: ATP-binding protein [Cellulophaga]MBU2996691.1 GHKL domain-containing protein [Cellulophaga baltica]MDO6768085.1 ATP-binding protein [Cellulophaga sp. 1_MG-2023]